MKTLLCIITVLVLSCGCAVTPLPDEPLETNTVAELWPYLDWRTNGGEQSRYLEHLKEQEQK